MESWKKDLYTFELYHHGVLGQKWGVRRYQPYPKNHSGGKEIGEAAIKSNSARSSENKKTIKNRSVDNVNNSISAMKQASDVTTKINRVIDSSSEAIQKPVDMSSISDNELRARVNRMLLEKQYRDLSMEHITPGKNRVQKVLSATGDILAASASVATLALTIKKLMG